MSELNPNPGNSDIETRRWAAATHIAAVAGYVIPFGNIIGPLLVWQLKKEDGQLIDDQGKESVNFQITVSIAMLISALLTLILIGFLMIFVIGLGALILVVIAAIKANDGEAYRYPLTLRFIK
ncbi:MAG: DUF4870 domain-containing protein [Pseudomonadales bacterium]|jgi:uncharacterized Tic20 family protein|nr:DUF4870 domain-containing protein [Pseudomonadales bacterium]